MTSIHPSPLLKFALRADAIVSAAVAALQLLLLDWLAGTLVLPRPLLLGTGVFLLLYVAMLVLLSNASSVWRALILLVVVGNVGWAVGCVAMLAESLVAPSVLGAAFVAVQALTVLAFAALEWSGLKASRGVSNNGAAGEGTLNLGRK
ncbi:MAG: hypothetical protein ABIT83_20365 [Massilia sp.]